MGVSVESGWSCRHFLRHLERICVGLRPSLQRDYQRAAHPGARAPAAATSALPSHREPMLTLQHAIRADTARRHSSSRSTRRAAGDVRARRPDRQSWAPGWVRKRRRRAADQGHPRVPHRRDDRGEHSDDSSAWPSEGRRSLWVPNDDHRRTLEVHGVTFSKRLPRRGYGADDGTSARGPSTRRRPHRSTSIEHAAAPVGTAAPAGLGPFRQLLPGGRAALSSQASSTGPNCKAWLRRLRGQCMLRASSSILRHPSARPASQRWADRGETVDNVCRVAALPRRVLDSKQTTTAAQRRTQVGAGILRSTPSGTSAWRLEPVPCRRAPGGGTASLGPRSVLAPGPRTTRRSGAEDDQHAQQRDRGACEAGAGRRDPATLRWARPPCPVPRRTAWRTSHCGRVAAPSPRRRERGRQRLRRRRSSPGPPRVRPAAIRAAGDCARVTVPGPRAMTQKRDSPSAWRHSISAVHASSAVRGRCWPVGGTRRGPGRRIVGRPARRRDPARAGHRALLAPKPMRPRPPAGSRFLALAGVKRPEPLRAALPVPARAPWGMRVSGGGASACRGCRAPTPVGSSGPSWRLPPRGARAGRARSPAHPPRHAGCRQPRLSSGFPAFRPGERRRRGGGGLRLGAVRGGRIQRICLPQLLRCRRLAAVRAPAWAGSRAGPSASRQTVSKGEEKKEACRGSWPLLLRADGGQPGENALGVASGLFDRAPYACSSSVRRRPVSPWPVALEFRAQPLVLACRDSSLATRSRAPPSPPPPRLPPLSALTAARAPRGASSARRPSALIAACASRRSVLS